MTTVERVNGNSPNVWTAIENNRYVGRYLRLRSGRFCDELWPNSGFGNNLRFEADDTNSQKIEKLFIYTRNLFESITRSPLLRKSLFDLHGKNLGCWCVTWDGQSDYVPLCHAAYLARIVDTMKLQGMKGTLVSATGLIVPYTHLAGICGPVIVIRNRPSFISCERIQS